MSVNNRDTEQETVFINPDNNPERIMTVVLACICSDGVCMVADRKIVARDSRFPPGYANKIAGEKRNVVFASSGFVKSFEDFKLQVRVDTKITKDNVVSELAGKVVTINKEQDDKFDVLVGIQHPDLKD